MLYYFLYPLADQFKILNLLKYQTFRAGMAFMTAFVICFLITPMIIRFVRQYQKNGQPIRKDGPASHLAKAGTPTMGGFAILIALFISLVLWANWSDPFFLSICLITFIFGVIGFIDDSLKIISNSHMGIPGKTRLLLEFLASLLAVFILMNCSNPTVATGLTIPFFKNIVWDLGWFYLVFGMFVIVGTANAVNLTDGLDGLVSIPLIMSNFVFLIITYLSGNYIFSNYLHIPYIPGIGEVAVFCAGVMGAVLAFLWYNAKPAEIFMGDTGSLALGGALGTIAVATKHEIVLAIVGGIFVLEALSDIIQVGSYKLRGKRVFKMAPIHHHFEQKGMPETKIVIRFWIISILLALISLMTLKIR